jgi:FGGY-family pentulose kinase
VGIDGGTQALKVGIFDAHGTEVSTAAAEYPTTFPRSGWAEQDPVDWWEALGAASRRCLAAAGIDAREVAGVCADGTTCTLVALDADDRPVGPALLWMDVRAAEQARRITETGHAALRYAPSGVSAEWMPPKALWLKEHRPEAYGAARTLMEYTDWLPLRLTGRRTLNRCTATQRWFYDGTAGGWQARFFESAGLEDVYETLPAEVLPLGARVGEVTAEAAAHTDFAQGTPVFAGGGDAPVGTLALGVVRPGQVALVTGSSNVLMGYSAAPLHAKGLMGAFPDAVLPGLRLIEAGQVSTGSVIAWFRAQFARDLLRDHADDPGAVYRRLDEEAAVIPRGAGGVVVLETFQGNRSPHADPLARGAVWGLSLHSTRAHVYRALLEGIAYGTAQILEVLAEHGARVEEVTMAGGAARSRFFMQLYADVCGLPLRTTENAEASLLGSAIVAAVGAGAYRTLEEGAAGMVRMRSGFEPDAAAHDEYRFWVGMYKETYGRLRELMHETAGRGS